MDLNIHKHSSTTQDWCNGELINDSNISNFESCTLKFNYDEKDSVDALGIYLKSRNFEVGIHFRFTILSGELSLDGKRQFLVETKNTLCKEYNEIRVIFEKFKNTGRFN